MLRTATAADTPALSRLRCTAVKETMSEAAGWIERIAGPDHILVVQKPAQQPTAMLGAIPVESAGRKGIWFCGMAADAAQPRELWPQLLQSCMRAFAAKGYDFALATPDSEKQSEGFAALGFGTKLPVRVLRKQIPKDVLAQAEFDSLTVRRLQQMRLRFQPGCVTVPETAMAEVMTQLYRKGLTIVSNRRGYGLYYTAGDTLQFLELQADNDHCADVLLQAAREKTGADTAQILLAENQALYLGAGRRCGYGLLAFMKKPFPVTDMYFRMLL